MSEDKQQELGQLITHHLSEAHGEDIMRSIAQKYIEEGEARGKAELIKLMFIKGKTVEEIMEFTGLPITEIDKLKS
ncbi:PD-(D/E)XK nuclease family transposase domain protein (plasmid) [Candidatus Trichorickettsia mobilis]|nr:PD-(D/E)XK nuclease family transposase domain protein [Candidatus Trichorickettsia mobilis]